MDAGTTSRLLARAVAYGLVTIWGAAVHAADAPRQGGRVEILHFADRPVTVVRGGDPGAAPRETPAARRETVGFGNGTARPVIIVRGTGEPAASALPATPRVPLPATRTAVERIAFAGPAPASVTILRGTEAAIDPSPPAAFLPATALDFERIAEAVHGVESSYGADPAMWRPDPDGPQGPMQVSAAAARDSGGGNRFDPGENRLLGRDYLARMLRRYGNWADALAAYNWGPGNVDRWVAGGRERARLPLETTRYIGRVLREAKIR